MNILSNILLYFIHKGRRQIPETSIPSKESNCGPEEKRAVKTRLVSRAKEYGK